MRSRKTSMAFAATALVVLGISSARASYEMVHEFALELGRVIAESDVHGFLQLTCVPEPCTNSEIAAQRVFGASNSISSFERIMRNPSLKVQITGPYTSEDRWSNSTYTIIYYDPTNSPFNSEEKIPHKTGLRELYESFLQTEVTVSEGAVHFHRVPFHLEAHHPYVGDYG